MTTRLATFCLGVVAGLFAVGAAALTGLRKRF